MKVLELLNQLQSISDTLPVNTEVSYHFVDAHSEGVRVELPEDMRVYYSPVPWPSRATLSTPATNDIYAIESIGNFRLLDGETTLALDLPGLPDLQGNRLTEVDIYAFPLLVSVHSHLNNYWQDPPISTEYPVTIGHLPSLEGFEVVNPTEA